MHERCGNELGRTFFSITRKDSQGVQSLQTAKNPGFKIYYNSAFLSTKDRYAVSSSFYQETVSLIPVRNFSTVQDLLAAKCLNKVTTKKKQRRSLSSATIADIWDYFNHGTLQKKYILIQHNYNIWCHILVTLRSSEVVCGSKQVPT